MKIVLASRNEGKKREMQALLADYTVLNLNDIGFEGDIEETGDTFAQNARIKSQAVMAHLRQTGFGDCGVIADDSGLCVDALKGEPGVRSARYCPGSDDDRIDYLLTKMQNIPIKERTARFVSAVCYLGADGEEINTLGTCEGSILFERDGQGGFGYDPVFLCEETGESFARMSGEDKNRVSHRGRAIAAFIDELKGGI